MEEGWGTAMVNLQKCYQKQWGLKWVFLTQGRWSIRREGRIIKLRKIGEGQYEWKLESICLESMIVWEFQEIEYKDKANIVTLPFTRRRGHNNELLLNLGDMYKGCVWGKDVNGAGINRKRG